MKSELRVKFEELLKIGSSYDECNYENLLRSLAGLPFCTDKSLQEYYEDPTSGLKEIEAGSIFKSLEHLTKTDNYLIINRKKFHAVSAAFDLFTSKYGNILTDLKLTRNFNWKKELILYSNGIYEYVEEIITPRPMTEDERKILGCGINFFIVSKERLDLIMKFL